MHTEPALTLAQWLSPLYPVGTFAYSHGLEALMADGTIADRDALALWLDDVLAHGAGRSDALFAAAAFHAPAELGEIDAACRAFAPSRERLLETDRQGRSFAEVTGAVWGFDLAGRAYPVAFGAACARAGLPLELALQMYLQAFAANLVSAALRLLPLGQTEGQRILHRLSGRVAEVAAGARAGDLASLSGTAFLADIASMRHETQTVRLFIT